MDTGHVERRKNENKRDEKTISALTLVSVIVEQMNTNVRKMPGTSDRSTDRHGLKGDLWWKYRPEILSEGERAESGPATPSMDSG